MTHLEGRPPFVVSALEYLVQVSLTNPPQQHLDQVLAVCGRIRA